ncbi:MAG: sensor histidine kinase [Ignavibacteriales bacterium]|nr:MAG: sensor histidine kinase [Ignavibacteriales bacterium]
MNLIKNIKHSYYKTRIIITFSIIIIILVIVLSRVGYLFIKDLYLVQLQEQVNIVTHMIARQIEPAYNNLLELGSPTGSSEIFFRELIRRNLDPELHSEIFIFNDKLDVIIHSNPEFTYGETEPNLLLNKMEIFNLEINSGAASLPFKGDDDNWYLWGFNRLSENHWLAVRESAVRFETLDQLSTLFWLIGLGGVIITIFAGWFMANAVVKPLDKLIKFSSDIGKGNFEITTPTSMHGEIKQLSDAMEKMKTDLSENQKEKENLLAQIAHEIRNPLGGIELLANLVKENNEIEVKDKEYLDSILKEVQGLKSLITSYLNYGRPIPVHPEWVNPEKIFLEIENIFKNRMNEKNIAFSIHNKLNKIYFDPAHLRNVLLNLVANSLDAVPENGKVSLLSETNSTAWTISVKDNGTGISEENLKKIFNPFFTTKKNGTGLGLAICKKLCKENKAELAANNMNGTGSVFTISKLIKNDV